MTPFKSEQALATAIEHHQRGDLVSAEKLYRQILAAIPRQPDALHLLGVITHQSGQHEAAAKLVESALAERPGWREAIYNLALIYNAGGNQLRQSGQFTAAIRAYQLAIELKADSPQTMNSLGVTFQESGQLTEAITGYRAAIKLLPTYAEAYSNLGAALREAGQLQESVTAAKKSIELSPKNAAGFYNLGLALNDLGQFEQAISAHQQAVELQPAYAEAHAGLGDALLASGKLDNAILAYWQAIVIKPSFANAHFNLGKAFIQAGQLAEGQAAFRQAVAIDPSNSSYDSAVISTLFYQPGADARQIAEEHFRWNRQHAEPFGNVHRPHTNENSSDRRLRIGYVSPDIRQHPVGRFLLPLLEHHDRQRFEIFVYSDSKIADAITEKSRSLVDRWRETSRLKHDELAEQIRQDKIDILIDLCGHTSGSRLRVFARKPAPVQVTYLGYQGTTGLAAIDYRLTDSFADPVGATELLHAEKLYRLPQTNWCFAETEPSPAVILLPMIDQGFATFGSFNNLAKVTDDTLNLWAEILHDVPGSKLLLKSPALVASIARSRIASTFEKQQIDPARLILLGPEPRYYDHLAAYSRIDIALDAYPYHGTTTTCDALWMGVPVITLAGESHVSRVGVSLLNNVGHSEWIATDAEGYKKLAIDLAENSGRLTEIRQSLREQMRRSPLMDAAGFTTNVETAFEEMWKRWCGTDRRPLHIQRP